MTNRARSAAIRIVRKVTFRFGSFKPPTQGVVLLDSQGDKLSADRLTFHTTGQGCLDCHTAALRPSLSQKLGRPAQDTVRNGIRRRLVKSVVHECNTFGAPHLQKISFGMSLPGSWRMGCQSCAGSFSPSIVLVGNSEIHDLFDILREMNSRYSLHDGFWASALGSLCFERFCRAFFKWYCPLTVEERHHLPDAPFLLCSNHTSHADSAVLMTASERSFRSFALIGASDYFFRSRRLRWAVSPLMNVIPIDREPGAKSLSACLATCRQFMQQTGGSLILYPEGTRSQDGKVRAFKSGAALFAIELDVPVVPAYIEGTHHILPKGHYVPRAGPVTVRFGEPVELARLQSGELPRERRRRAVEQLTESIRMLSSRREARELAPELQEKGTTWQFH